MRMNRPRAGARLALCGEGAARTPVGIFAVGVLAALAGLGKPLPAIDAADVQHRVIHYEEGRHCGMPAFHGAQQWQWGDEILVAYNYSVWAPGTQGDPLKAAKDYALHATLSPFALLCIPLAILTTLHLRSRILHLHPSVQP